MGRAIVLSCECEPLGWSWSLSASILCFDCRCTLVRQAGCMVCTCSKSHCSTKTHQGGGAVSVRMAHLHPTGRRIREMKEGKPSPKSFAESSNLVLKLGTLPCFPF